MPTTPSSPLPLVPPPDSPTAIQPPVAFPDGTPIYHSNQDWLALQAKETATVWVNGLKLVHWESVYVEHRWADAYPMFRFTTSEEVPVPPTWTSAQIKPEDEVAIWLGWQLAISGLVISRETSFDASRHGIQIQGVGLTWLPTRGAHLDKDSSFDNMPFMAIVAKVLAPWKGQIGWYPFGEVSGDPLKDVQYQPGEDIWTFLERTARLVNVTVGSDPYKNLVFIGGHALQATSRIAEGENLLACQATISVEDNFNLYVLRAQQPAGDQTSGSDAAQMETRLQGNLGRWSGRFLYSPRLTPAENPMTYGLMQLRNAYEQRWSDGTIIVVLATVQGWYVPDGSRLWSVGEDVDFYSPSAMLYDEKLKIQTVTFMQDSGKGTTTTLELVAPWKLRDVPGFHLGAANLQTDFPPASSNQVPGPAYNQNPALNPQIYNQTNE